MPPAWPDTVDFAGILLMGGLLLGLPIAGYVFMVLDIRAYYRRIRNALVIFRGYVRDPNILPAWVRRDSPPCLQALGLSMPVTEDEVLAAYRERVKSLHPDAGGSRTQFIKLQKHFEQAMSLAGPSPRSER